MPGKKYLLIALLFAVVAAFFGYHRTGTSNANDQEPKAGGAQIAKLGKERRIAIEKAFNGYFKDHAPNERPIMLTTYHMSILWLNADVDMVLKKEDRIAAYAGHLDRMKDWEKMWLNTVREDMDNYFFLMTQACRKEAEMWLEKERSSKK